MTYRIYADDGYERVAILKRDALRLALRHSQRNPQLAVYVRQDRWRKYGGHHSVCVGGKWRLRDGRPR